VFLSYGKEKIEFEGKRLLHRKRTPLECVERKELG